MRRRTFIKTALLPVVGMQPLTGTTLGLPPASLRATDPERYWTRLRHEQFLMPEDFAYLHNGTLGVPPRPVIAAMTEGLLRSASLSSPVLERWGAPIETVNSRSFNELRASLSVFLRCQADELTLTHNTTEALQMLADGLPLAAGDEVLITDQEHDANIRCWRNRAVRSGIAVKVAAIAPTASSGTQIVEAFEKSFTAKTRVLSFSGITTRTGLCLPVAQIVAAARSRGIVTIVDGAHMPGQVPVDLKALGCDYFAASPHKWMFAPPGCGVLFARGDRLEQLARALYPAEDHRDQSAAERLMQVGTNNSAVFDGYGAGLNFLLSIGPESVYSRVKSLAHSVRENARQLNDAVLITPENPELYAGMVTFGIRGVDLRALADVFKAERIRVAPGRTGIRISTHIHTRPADIERFFTVLRRELAR